MVPPEVKLTNDMFDTSLKKISKRSIEFPAFANEVIPREIVSSA